LRLFALCFVFREEVMNQAAQPSKEQVRHWMEQRQSEHKPPPDPKQIRRELGWDMIDAERNKQREY